MKTGAGTPGPILRGATYLSAVQSLTFSPEGELLAVNSNLSTPARTALVTIDPATGAVALIGELPMDADGLAFSPDATAEPSNVMAVVGPFAFAIALVSAIWIAIGLLRRGRAIAGKK